MSIWPSAINAKWLAFAIAASKALSSSGSASALALIAGAR
jgi:hypothetical protein